MAQALGVQFLNKKGNIVPIEGGEDLLKANSLLTTKIDKRLKHISIDVACNCKNVLCGEKGVARVFWSQKGATSKQVEILSSALEHYASLIEVDTGLNVGSLPGSGASGGLGAGLLAFTNAVLHPRFDLIMNFINIEKEISTADLVFTAEGSLDFQPQNGKSQRRSHGLRKNQIPVIAITGTIGKGAVLNYQAGIDAYSSIIKKPVSLELAMKKAPKWIEECMESILRKIDIGRQLAKKEELKKVVI